LYDIVSIFIQTCLWVQNKVFFISIFRIESEIDLLTGELIMSEERIDTLEIRMTYLENYLNQINDIVLENSRLMEVLKKDQTSLRQQMNEVTNELPGSGTEKPPHY